MIGQLTIHLLLPGCASLKEKRGRLKPLPLREGRERYVELYLVFADRDYPGRAAWRLAEIIREQVTSLCPIETKTKRSPTRRKRKAG